MGRNSSEQAEKAIIQAILAGDFPPGSPLPGERELAGRLGVTRPTLREALQRLARDGWLSINHGRATLVNDFFCAGNLNVLSALAECAGRFQADFVVHLLEVRLVLAPAYARGAVTRQPARAVAYLVRSEDLGESPLEFAGYDWELHRTLAILSGNSIYPLILNGFSRLYLEMAPQYFGHQSCRDSSRSYYRRLLRAAMDRDPGAAEYITREVMEESIRLWTGASAGGALATKGG